MHRAMLALASRIVPRPLRADWLREWTAELWYVTDGCLRFCAGAFRDAICLRRQAGVDLRGSAACLAILALAAAAGVWIVSVLPKPTGPQPPGFVHALVVALSILILPATSAHAQGLYLRTFHCWAFLIVKCALLVVIVLALAYIIGGLDSRTGYQPHAAILGYVLAFRWALDDQRRRCPRCLRRLIAPVTIGHSAGTLLEWYGTELVCSEGHGVMHVPELERGSYCPRRWVTLDSSWQQLFR